MPRRAPVALAATLSCLALLGAEASTGHELHLDTATPVAVASATAAPGGEVDAPPASAEAGRRRAQRPENGRRRRRYREEADGRWRVRDRDEPTTPGTGTRPTTPTTTGGPADPLGSTTTTRTPARTTTTTTGSRPPVSVPDSTPPDGRWRPEQGQAWQIQLSTPVDLGVDAPIYEIDGELNDASVVAALHAAGRRAICYVDVGAAETYRSDYGAIPAVALGNVVDGWPDERWLDIRRIDLLAPVITQRLQMCKNKGFDAVDPDMIEGYADPASGFPLTYADQLRYNRWIADEVHARGMSVALKQDIDQVADLEPWFDLAVNEECAHYDECDAYRPFLAAGKAVFEIEYDEPTSRFCAPARALGIHAQRKRLSLDAWRQTC